MSAITGRDTLADEIRWNAIWNVIVLVVIAVMLLPLGRWALLWELVRAFCVLWGVLLLASALMAFVQHGLRVVDDPPSDAFVLSNMAVGVALLIVWGGYTALLVRDSAVGVPVWTGVLVHVAGVLAAHAAFSAVSSIYVGSIYRTLNAPVALAAFAVFAAWPPLARALFGWLA